MNPIANALVQLAAGVVFLIGFFSAIGVLVMRLLVKHIPVRTHAIIAVRSFAAGLLVVIVLSIAWAMARGATGNSVNNPLIDIFGLCITGSLISRDLKTMGVHRGFPGVGAIVAGSAVAGTTVLALAVAALFLRHG